MVMQVYVWGESFLKVQGMLWKQCVLLYYVSPQDQVDFGGMAAEAEPCHWCSLTFCCPPDRWQQRGSLTKQYMSWKCTKVCHWIPPCRKNGTHWHSLMLAEQLWRPTSGCEHSEVAGSAFLQWRQQCERQAMFWAAVHSCHTKKWRTLQLAHQCESADYNQGAVYGAECRLQRVGKVVAVLEYRNACAGCSTYTHVGTEGAWYASLLGPVLPTRGWRWQFSVLHHYWRWDVVSLLWAGVKMALHGVTALKFPNKEQVEDGLEGNKFVG